MDYNAILAIQVPILHHPSILETLADVYWRLLLSTP